MEELTLNQARSLLADYTAVAASRDDRIRAAAEAGLPVAEIAKLLGIGRSTVYRVLVR